MTASTSPRLRATVLPTVEDARLALCDLSDWSERIDIAVAWASSSAGSAPHWTSLDLAKVARALVGTHFFQTEPFVLAEFSALGVLKVISEPTGVFHPKLILGRSGDELRALVGSSNLTTGGFSLNTELGVLLEGDASHPEAIRLVDFMDALWSKESAFEPDAAWLAWYERRYRKRLRPSAEPGPIPGSLASTSDVLSLDWSNYFSLLLAQQGKLSVHGETLRVFQRKNSYRAEARACRRAFREHPRFTTMPQTARALVGGYGGGSTGYFGHMGRAIQFRDLAANRPAQIAAHLDLLPISGSVPATTIESVVRGVLGVVGVGVPSGTRLLTVKRPDLFFPVNKANASNVAAMLGPMRYTSRRAVDDYLAILSNVRRSTWWRSPMPDDATQRRAWRFRVALLDVILYSA